MSVNIFESLNAVKTNWNHPMKPILLTPLPVPGKVHLPRKAHEQAALIQRGAIEGTGAGSIKGRLGPELGTSCEQMILPAHTFHLYHYPLKRPSSAEEDPENDFVAICKF